MTMLLPRIANGDSTAVAQCLEQYGNLVWSVARRWSPSVADAEDAVQEIFIDLWKSAHRYDPQVASESTFVMMIARRRLIDRRRRCSRELASNGEEGLRECADVAVEPDVAAERGEEAKIASQLLAELRDDERRVLRLSVHEGLSHSEIASRIGVPLGTVKTHIRRGLAKLRQRLSEGAAQTLSRSAP
jgi:RNA polymerase sigma-70 factor (ECF subfamily)